MHRPRSFSLIAFHAMPLAMIPLCAGCWEKIEYTGPRTTSAVTRGSETDKQPKVLETTPTDTLPPAAVPETPTIAVEQTPSTPPPADPLPTPPDTAVVDQPPPPKSDDDRYGESVAEAAATPPAATPPQATPETPATGSEGDPAERHTDATPVSATADAAPVPNAIDSYRAAWLLGSRLSVAALANDRRVAAANVPIWFDDARTAAKLLGTTLTDLPEPAAVDDKSLASQQAINYLVVNGQRIGRELSKQHGAEQSALFEVALKSNILLLLYTPDASAGNSIASAITRAAPQAELPEEFWKPLVETIGKQAPQADVRAAVKKMHVDVDRYLAERAERKGQ